jgi:hypothetical protein
VRGPCGAAFLLALFLGGCAGEDSFTRAVVREVPFDFAQGRLSARNERGPQDDRAVRKHDETYQKRKSGEMV